ncbi:MAG: ABC transporter substrate-binding protein [Candidatus Brocadia sp.]|nr:ABC transporter substrate-binding protein [Candidatus Brocadia sp.]
MAKKYGKPHRYLYLTVMFWFILASLFQTHFLIPHATAAENTVIIIRSQQITAYNEAIKGFEEGCKGKNISIKAIYDLHGDTEEGKRIIQNIKDSRLKPRVILAIGVLAATLVKEQFPDIPIVFCMVINHDRFNLQGANITGISSEAPIEDQFTIFKEILGKNKNVGVIYDPSKTGKIISEATIAAKKFEFNLIKTEVLSEKEVASALKNIINKIDALWMIPDSTVITKNTLSIIAKITLEHRLPIFCTSDAMVKAGALISVSPNYAYTGLQAAQIAQTLLNDPTKTSLGIKQPDKLKLTLNTQTAEIVGINPSSIKYFPDVILYPQ